MSPATENGQQINDQPMMNSGTIPEP